MTDATKRLDRFGNEVLRKGPKAVLPQNLSDQWLATLAAEAEGILAPSGNARAEPACLTVVVCSLLRLYGRSPHLVPEDELVECVKTYAIHIALERLFRSTGIKHGEATKPTVANILDKDAEIIASLPPHLMSQAETTLN
jgi:hypothetical protein